MTLLKTIVVSMFCLSVACTSETKKTSDTGTDGTVSTDTGKDISKIEDQGDRDLAKNDTNTVDTRTDAADVEPDVAPVDLRLFPELAEVTAPDQFQAQFITSFGDFVVSFERVSAPNGIDRFYSLTKAGYFEDILVFRAIDGFMFQFGVHGEPEINDVWKGRLIPDDPVGVLLNTRGAISFASSGPDTRSNQLFINLSDNAFLDRGFAPLGNITQGIENIDGVNTEYGENPMGFQTEFAAKGNVWALETYPNFSVIEKIIILDE